MRSVSRVCLLVLPVVFVAAACRPGAGTAQPRASASHHATIANPWKVVSYHGVHVRVPAAWPVIDAMHAPWCGGPFPVTPTVYIGGHGNMARYCPALQPRGPGDDGVWLQAGNPPPDARPVTVAGGTIVAEERGQPAARGERVVRLWYHRVLVEIGIGRHRKVARQILRSLGYMRGRPDSKVADVCPRSKALVRMPTPRRLGRRLVVRIRQHHAGAAASL